MQCLSSSRGVSIPTCQRTRELQFHDAEHHHRGHAHKHVRKPRQDGRRRTDRTHTVGALLPMPSCLGIGGHTGESRQGHPRYTSASTEEGRWWPETSSTRHHHNDKTKVTIITRLGFLHGSGAGLSKPQVHDATAELGDKVEKMIVSDRIVDPL